MALKSTSNAYVYIAEGNIDGKSKVVEIGVSGNPEERISRNMTLRMKEMVPHLVGQYLDPETPKDKAYETLSANDVKRAVCKKLADHIIRGKWFSVEWELAANTLVETHKTMRMQIFKGLKKEAEYNHELFRRHPYEDDGHGNCITCLMNGTY